MIPRRLSDILANGNRDHLAATWDSTKPAEDFAPLPAGVYVAHVIRGELFSSRQNATPGYKLIFKVIEGEHAGRQIWHEVWLTEAALSMTKRDLGKLGVTALAQLELPLPQGIRCKVKLALRKDDGGADYNRVRSFEVIGIDPPETDAFAPVDCPQAPQGDGGTVGAVTEAEASADLPKSDADESALPAEPSAKPDDGIPI